MVAYIIGSIILAIIGSFCGLSLAAGETGVFIWVLALGGEFFAHCCIITFIEDCSNPNTSIATKIVNIIGTVFWGFGLAVLFFHNMSLLDIEPSEDIIGLIGLVSLFIAPYFIVASLYALFDGEKGGAFFIAAVKLASSVLLYLGGLEKPDLKNPECKLIASLVIVSLLALISWILTVQETISSIRAKRREKREQRKLSYSNRLISAASNNDKNQVLNLLEKGADIDYGDSSEGKTALIQAVISGKFDIVSLLLEKGADANRKDYNNKTPLHYAVLEKNEKIASLLIEKGAEVSIYFEDEPLMFFTIENDLTDLVHLLIEKGVHKKTFDYDDIEKTAPLFFAAGKGKKDIVSLLLKNNADANDGAEFNGKKISPLHYAVLNDEKEIASLLIDNGANIDCDENGMTPLTAALGKNDKDMAQLLIKKGADVNHVTGGIMTPLSYGIIKNNKEMVLFLIEHGADINYVTPADTTPLWDAIGEKNEEIISLLIEKGADVNLSIMGNEFTVLQYAICNANKNIVSILLNAGAEVNKNSSKIETALLDAVDTKNYDSEIVSLLIEHGADVNLESAYNGQTPLTCAVSQNNKDAVSLLLKNGADPNKKSSKFGSPLMIAFAAVSKEICSLLIESGANTDEVFIVASSMSKTDAAQFLLDRGANVNCESVDGVTPLKAAVAFQQKEMVLFLISNGADVNLECSCPTEKKIARTPLEAAIATGDTELVSLLITYGADVNYKTKNGNTPLLFAALNGKADVVPLLKEAGEVSETPRKNKTAASSASTNQKSSDLTDDSAAFNAVLVALSKISAKNGAEIFSAENNKKLKALVSDLVPQDNEVAVKLKQALSCDFTQIILDAADKSDSKKEKSFKKAADTIVAETKIEKDTSVLIVKLVALSLGWDLERLNLR